MRNLLHAAAITCLLAGSLSAQVYTPVDKPGLLSITGMETDSTVVVNFWATWCSPCVKEIPHFEKLFRSDEGSRIKMALVSLDFPSQAAERLPAFLQKYDITAPVYLMTDVDYNSWIDLVDTRWSGAIPATLIFRGEKRLFFERVLSEEELFLHVKQISD